jgi:hypothetical protein
MTLTGSELLRICGEDKLESPRKGSPEWDVWYNEFSARHRHQCAGFMGGALTPEDLADRLYCSTDDALRAWRDAVVIELDRGRSDRVDAWEWEMAEQAALLGEILGPQEVADMLGVAVGTVHQWRKRDAIVAPSRIVSGVPLWTRAEVLGWALATGRATVEPIETF